MESEEISSLTEKMLSELDTFHGDGDKVVNRRQFDPGIPPGGRAFIQKLRTFSELNSHHPYGSSERVELALKDSKLPSTQLKSGRPVEPRRNYPVAAQPAYNRPPPVKSAGSVAYRPPPTLPKVSRKNPNYPFTYQPRGNGINMNPPKEVKDINQKFLELTLEVEREIEGNKVAYGICSLCNQPLTDYGEVTEAMGKLFHSKCFICSSCGRELRGKAFYNVGDVVYCEEDYLYSGFQQVAEKCAVCGHLIIDMVLHAVNQSFHPNCFKCTLCQCSLDGVPFTADSQGKVYCVEDYHQSFAPKCAVCGLSITPAEGTDETIRVVSMSKDYHLDCYKCEGCDLQLTDEVERRCYPLEGHLFCQECHVHWARTGGVAQPVTDV